MIVSSPVHSIGVDILVLGQHGRHRTPVQLVPGSIEYFSVPETSSATPRPSDGENFSIRECGLGLIAPLNFHVRASTPLPQNGVIDARLGSIVTTSDDHATICVQRDARTEHVMICVRKGKRGDLFG